MVQDCEAALKAELSVAVNAHLARWPNRNLWAHRGQSPFFVAAVVAVEQSRRAEYDGAKRKKGSKLPMAVDTLGHLLTLHVTPASAEDRGQVDRLTRAVQSATSESVDLAYVDQGYSSERAANAARKHGIELEVVKLPEAKKDFVLLPRRWVTERSFGRTTRFHRLVKDYERCASTVADLHRVAFVCLMLRQAALLATGT